MPTPRVERVLPLSDDIFEFVLQRAGVDFRPGDCVAIFNGDSSRPYSIASPPGASCLRFVIRRIRGGRVSPWLATRTSGDRVRISAPFGWFRPGRDDDADAPRVFVATGTGIAPFLSCLRDDATLRPALCLYGVRRQPDAVAVDFLAQRCPFRLCVSREPAAPPHHRGRVTDLLHEIPRTAQTHYYLCGLDAMIDQVSSWLENRGTPLTHIHREVFFNA